MADELNLLPCPFCGGKPELRKTPNMWMVECDNAACGSNPDALAVLKHDVGVAWNRRAAPIAAQLDAELPPLPDGDEYSATRMLPNGELAPRFTGTTLRNYARQVVAPYAERIRLLERELAEVRSLAKQGMCHGLLADDYCSQIVAKIGPRVIDRENAQQYMEESLWAFIDCAGNYPGIKPNARVWPHVFAYIDGRTAGTAPEGWKLVPEVPTEAMIVAIERKVDEQLVASGMWARDMQRQDGADIYEAGIAAAPSPQENTKP